MPDLDFLVLCDHVRADGGAFHILSACIDRVLVPALPGLAQIGVAGRIKFDRDEVDGRERIASVTLIGPDDTVALEVRGAVNLTVAQDVPDDWPVYAGLAVNLMVPLQAYGR